jgi:hypothetical protein
MGNLTFIATALLATLLLLGCASKTWPPAENGEAQNETAPELVGIIDNMPDAVNETDLNGSLIAANDSGQNTVINPANTAGNATSNQTGNTTPNQANNSNQNNSANTAQNTTNATNTLQNATDTTNTTQNSTDATNNTQGIGTCHVDQNSVTKDLQAYRYEVTVYFDGFHSGAKLVWVCDNSVVTATITEDPGFGMPRYQEIYCDFPGYPKSNIIPISVNNVSCGQISTR